MGMAMPRLFAHHGPVGDWASLAPLLKDAALYPAR
jgi:hypothetical protein